MLGSVDLVRALALGSIRAAVMCPPGASAAYARNVEALLAWTDAADDPDGFVAELVRFGRTRPDRPVLYYATDDRLAVISRHRELLQRYFRFVIADSELVQDLLAKDRFQGLARRHGLPVPASGPLLATTGGGTGLPFPLLVKPVSHRDRTWRAQWGSAKAVEIDDAEQLQRLWPRLRASGDLLAQQLIEGPESRIESYHAYVDSDGDIAGEFTGRKIRTLPERFGQSTALEITDAPDVAAIGRAIVRQIELRGVVKVDLKRDAQDFLHLLEINPRFNLWHHLGARAGVNLPALVFADLTGRPRPSVGRARPGTRWCQRDDRHAARAQGMPLGRWLRWAATCEAKAGVALDDPMPLIRTSISPRLRRWRGR